MPGYGFTNPYGTLNSATPTPTASIRRCRFRPSATPSGSPTKQRVDRDKAVFAQATWDITSQLSLNGGIRYFTYDNTLQGFFGYSAELSLRHPA